MNKEQILTTLIGARAAQRKSQKELAKELQVNNATLSRWEAAQVPPTLDILLKWCDILGFNLKIEKK